MAKLFVLAISLAQLLVLISAEKAYHVKIHKDGENGLCTILDDVELKRYIGLKNENEVHINKRPAVQAPAEAMLTIQDQSILIELFGKNRDVIQGHIDTLCKFIEPLKSFELEKGKRAPEVVKIIDGGPNSNRIDVVFMGDGYTASERQQFFDDINRLTTEMFEGETFRSWLPLYNIWAIYDESVESGIGYNGAKNTPFRLYREAGQLRGIFTGNAAYARQVCALTGTSGCDYPSLIGNDDFYGGLGGEFVISTKSDRTGTVVLRHEMGHNFVNVGEEYDNGQVYRGVNAATSVASLGWSHWLSGTRREERAMYRLLAYPWANLANGPQSFSFTSDGSYSRWYCLVSVSAAGEADSLEFTLDGQILPWTTTGYDDREFYSWSSEQGFSSGSHTFTVRSKTASTHPMIPRMIASINIHEFGSESEFVMDNDYVSAYPTWDVSRRKTFRPTNAGCLMRNMTHASFCTICKEGMWYQFLARISLIDGVEVSAPDADGNRNAILSTLKLGQWRPIGNEVEGEKLEIRWILNSVDQTQYDDQLSIDNIASGSWRVTVTLTSPDIRADPSGYTQDSQTFTVPT